MRPRSGLVALVLVLALVLTTGVYVWRRDGSGGGGALLVPPAVRDATSYAGLGAWIDVFDYAPAYQGDGARPSVSPDAVDVLAAHGVDTLYLQATRHDDRSADDVVDPALIGEFLSRARTAGIRVVGWHLPTFADVDADLANLLLIDRFEHEGHRFDGVAVDIEYREAVPDPAERNRRLMELSRRLRQEVGDEALGAIVPPPVLLEVINPDNWPAFPWRDLADLYDVWLPMAYWTFRNADSGYRDGYRYTAESVQRLRANLGDADALVHPIGGIADAATEEQYAGFVRAAGDVGAIGLSMYDFRTTSEGGWSVLQQAAPKRAHPIEPSPSLSRVPSASR